MTTDNPIFAPLGFRAAGTTAGIKVSGRSDIALFVADAASPAAAMFTRNACCAAPIVRGREVMRGGKLRAIVVNSGNANAATGEQGLKDAEEMARLAAAAIAIQDSSSQSGEDDAVVKASNGGKAEAGSILSSSTGVIGHLLPMDKIERGVFAAASKLGSDDDAWRAASEAIMTTDTHSKLVSREVEVEAADGSSKTCRILGVAKGAGMIHPDMATLLTYFFTDAKIDSATLDAIFRAAIDQSFNAITIDGDTSTNDTAAIIAGGAADFAVESLDSAEGVAFSLALSDVAGKLARMIVRDQEGGALTLCRIEVTGAACGDCAKKIARTVAKSLLFRSALHGADPNWGRIVMAVGNAGVALKLEDVTIHLGPFELLRAGRPLEFPEAEASEYLRRPETRLQISVGGGEGAFTYFCGDLSEEYITFNADYTT